MTNRVVARAHVRGTPACANRTVFCLDCAKDSEFLEELGLEPDDLVDVIDSEIRDEIYDRTGYPNEEELAEPWLYRCEECGDEIYDADQWERGEYDTVITYGFLMSAIFNGDTSSFENHCRVPGPSDNDDPTDDDLTLAEFYKYIDGYAVVNETLKCRFRGKHSDFGHADHLACARNAHDERDWRRLRGITMELLIEKVDS